MVMEKQESTFMVSRSNDRYEAFRTEFEKLRQRFGGHSTNGYGDTSHWWPVEMPRRISRQIARDKVKENLAARPLKTKALAATQI